jgi:hypothetical protein
MRARVARPVVLLVYPCKVNGTIARRDRDRIAIIHKPPPVIGSPEAGAARIKLHQKGVIMSSASKTRLMRARGGNAGEAVGHSRKVDGTIARRDRDSFIEAFLPTPP